MKHIIKLGVFILVAQVVFLNSCVEPEDIMTADVKTGGLVIPSTDLLFKAGSGQSFDVVVEIPIGPGIQSLELTKIYNQGDTLLSNIAIMDAVDVSGVNANDTAFISYTLAYSDLKSGLTVDGGSLPDDETLLGVGDYWTIYYTSIMEDGRAVVNNATTVISVANKYSGYYQVNGFFHHPTSPDPPYSRAIDEVKFMGPISKTASITTAADFGSGYDMIITVDASNNCTVAPGPSYALSAPVAIVPSTDNYYDPATGKFVLNYQYAGSNGMRVIENETYTPIE